MLNELKTELLGAIATKADSEDVPSDADIRTVVDGMVAPTSSNALKSALALKVRFSTFTNLGAHLSALW
jgi:hypothetical protein